MQWTREGIEAALTRGCSEVEFAGMRCPACGGKLKLRVQPHGAFFVHCLSDSTHLALHGCSQSPPRWWRADWDPLGWY